jgi:hypothetical protein
MRPTARLMQQSFRAANGVTRGAPLKFLCSFHRIRPFTQRDSCTASFRPRGGFACETRGRCRFSTPPDRDNREAGRGLAGGPDNGPGTTYARASRVNHEGPDQPGPTVTVARCMDRRTHRRRHRSRRGTRGARRTLRASARPMVRLCLIWTLEGSGLRNPRCDRGRVRGRNRCVGTARRSLEERGRSGTTRG